MKNKCKSARKIEYWLERGYSQKDAETMRMSRIPGTLEYFTIFKGYSNDDAVVKVVEHNKSKAVTLETMIKRYGEEIGTKKFNEYRVKQAYTNSFEYKKKKHGWSKKQFNEYNKSRAVTLTNMVNRHGEVAGAKKFNEYRKRQAYAGCKLEYFIEKLGPENGLIEYNRLSKLKANNFDSFLHRCDGDVELANKMFHDYLKKYPLRSFSKISQELFVALYESIKTKYEQIYFATLNTEWYIRYRGESAIMLDFFVRDVGKVIEFYGDYWHCNPIFYKKNETVHHPNEKNRLVESVWARDKERIDKIKNAPYINDIKIVWEHDYITNNNCVIHDCLNFLKK